MGVTLATAAAVVGAAGSIFQGVAANKAAQYRGQVLENNRQIAEANKLVVSDRAGAQQFQQGLKSRAEIAAARASFAGQGLDVNTGSPASIQAAMAALSRMDSLTIASNAQRDIHSLDVESSNMASEASMVRQEGKNALISSFFNAGQSLLGGAKQNYAFNNQSSLAIGRGTAPLNLYSPSYSLRF